MVGLVVVNSSQSEGVDLSSDKEVAVHHFLKRSSVDLTMTS